MVSGSGRRFHLATNPNNASPYQLQNIPSVEGGALPGIRGVEIAGGGEADGGAVAADVANHAAAAELDEIEGMFVGKTADRLRAVDQNEVARQEIGLHFGVAEEVEDGGMGQAVFHLLGEGVAAAIAFRREGAAGSEGVADDGDAGIVEADGQEVAHAEAAFVENSIG